MSQSDQSSEDLFHPGGRLRLELLHPATITVLRETLGYAKATNWDCVRTPHLFMGLLAAPDASLLNWGRRLETELSELLEQFRSLFHQDDGEVDAVLFLNREFLSDNVIRLLRDAQLRAESNGRPQVRPADLLISLLTTPQSIVAECFERIGMPAARLTELAVMAENSAGPA